jgi:lipoprotein-anchoring transpeptidase ErfK/SrfK
LKYNKGFFADNEINRQGTEIATGDINGNGNNEIVVTLISDNKNLIKFFDYAGRQLYNTIEVPFQQFFEPLKVAVFDLNGDNQDEIIVGASIGNKPEVKVFNYLGDELLSFEAYASSFTGGVDVSAGNFSGGPLIVTGAGYSGGPHVRFFNWEKNAVINSKFFPYDQSFRGGVNVATFQGKDKLYLGFLPQTINFKSQLTSFGKVIKVDISEQKLYAYDKGRMVKSFLVSTGKRGFDTPYGQFSVYRKTPVARMSWNYGPNNPYNYDLPNVPHILAFSGPFTIHGAYWHHNWGYRMSHGCVNVSLPMAKWIYDWAPVGTAVIIEP